MSRQQRIYRDARGREVARTSVALNSRPFQEMAAQVSHPGFTKRSVGLSESSIYHGSKTVEHDFVRDGVRGTRIAGSQYLDVVSTAVTINSSDFETTLGERLTICLINPSALGSILARMSQTFEECKFNRLTVIYKPVVPATTAGALAMYFRNDVQNPAWSTGLEELSHAATHPSFQDFSVWTPARIDVDPADVMKRYWDEINGDVSAEVQGIVTVISTSDLARNVTYGHLYLEYDCEFTAPELDYEVDEINVGVLNVTWSGATTSKGTPISVRMKTATAGQVSGAWDPTGSTPSAPDIVAYGVVTTVDDNGLPDWSTMEDNDSHAFNKGQAFFVRFQGIGTTNFANDTIRAHVFTDLTSAMTATFSGDGVLDEANDGQLVEGSTIGSTSGVVSLRLRFFPVANGE